MEKPAQRKTMAGYLGQVASILKQIASNLAPFFVGAIIGFVLIAGITACSTHQPTFCGKGCQDV